MSGTFHTKTEGLSGAPLFGPSKNYTGGSTPVSCRSADHLTQPVGAMPFELAAVLCGHDPLSGVGAQLAREDHRVWDLVGTPYVVIHHERSGR